MDRHQFISILRGALAGQLSNSQVEEHVKYYEQYISEELTKGRSEEEVFAVLGDPRLLAKTILTVGEAADSRADRSDAEWTSAEDQPQSGIYTKAKETGRKVLIVLAVCLIVIVVFRILGGILSLVLPILLPVLLIVLVVRTFSGKR